MSAFSRYRHIHVEELGREGERPAQWSFAHEITDLCMGNVYRAGRGTFEAVPYNTAAPPQTCDSLEEAADWIAMAHAPQHEDAPREVIEEAQEGYDDAVHKNQGDAYEETMAGSES